MKSILIILCFPYRSILFYLYSNSIPFYYSSTNKSYLCDKIVYICKCCIDTIIVEKFETISGNTLYLEHLISVYHDFRSFVVFL